MIVVGIGFARVGACAAIGFAALALLAWRLVALALLAMLALLLAGLLTGLLLVLAASLVLLISLVLLTRLIVVLVGHDEYFLAVDEASPVAIIAHATPAFRQNIFCNGFAGFRYANAPSRRRKNWARL
jgi:hypothetical protein